VRLPAAGADAGDGNGDRGSWTVADPSVASSYEAARGRVPSTEDLMTRHWPEPADRLLTPTEVAALFRVDPKTVTRWARAGKLSSIRTLGGHRRYRESEIKALLGGIPHQRVSASEAS
jgi:excisionase family DNA binding protein